MNKEKKKEKGSGLESFYKSGKGDGLGWAIIFIWGAIVLALDLTEILNDFEWWNGWSVFFTGFGIIVLVNSIIHVVAKQQSKAVGGFIFGFILLIIGLGDLVDTTWALVAFLVIVAVLILNGVFAHKK